MNCAVNGCAALVAADALRDDRLDVGGAGEVVEPLLEVEGWLADSSPRRVGDDELHWDLSILTRSTLTGGSAGAINREAAAVLDAADLRGVPTPRTRRCRKGCLGTSDGGWGTPQESLERSSDEQGKQAPPRVRGCPQRPPPYGSQHDGGEAPRGAGRTCSGRSARRVPTTIDWPGRESHLAHTHIYGTGEGGQPRLGPTPPDLRGVGDTTTPGGFSWVHIDGTRFDNTTWRLSSDPDGAKVRIITQDPVTRQVIVDAFHRAICPLRIETSGDGGKSWTWHPDRSPQWEWETALSLASALLHARTQTWNVARVVSRDAVELVRYGRYESRPCRDNHVDTANSLQGRVARRRRQGAPPRDRRGAANDGPPRGPRDRR